jgi:formiminotetrahydrofolate cyclodeaminase
LLLLGELSKIGNQNALSDARVGIQLALAAINGARYNVEANLSLLPEPEAAEIRNSLASLKDSLD